MITMQMPFVHRSTSDLSELAVGNIEANIARFERTIGLFLGTDWPMLSESLTAGLLMEQGHSVRALSHALTANAVIKNRSTPETKFCAMATLLCILDTLGKENEAERVIKNISSGIEGNKSYYLKGNFNALLTRRKLMSHNTQAAHDWLSGYESTLDNDLCLYGLYMTFTTCRAYITCGDYDSAIIFLTKALEIASAHDRPLDIIEAQMLLSIAHWKRKHNFQNEALCYMKEAVSTAHPYSYTRIFVNEAPELVEILQLVLNGIEHQSKKNSDLSDFIKTLYLKMLESKKTLP
jgi:ATP/maltotriose-dependent transcriptional regulator MalT